MTFSLGRPELIVFVMIDSNGQEVTGLGSAFTVQISKNGGALAPGLGMKAEIGSGLYSYLPTAGELDTVGPLAVTVNGAGAEQQNLVYDVKGSDWQPGSGANVLTVEEGAAVLRSAEDDPNLLMLLPGVDAYLQWATGRDWAADSPVRQEAKNAARILLVRWHEDPGGMGNVLGLGLQAALAQLRALALRYRTFAGRQGSGSICLPGVKVGDTVGSVTGRVGASGDQSAAFEAVITVDDQIRQVSASDLSDHWYTAYLVPPEAMP